MSQFDLQACDDRRYIQKLIANLITEFAKLQNSVCIEASNKVTELLNTERPINVCGLVSPALLINISQGKTTDALDLVFTSLSFPPYTAKILTQGGYNNLSIREKTVIRNYVRTVTIRESTEFLGNTVEKIIAEKVKCPTPERSAEIIETLNKVKSNITRVQALLEVLNRILTITYAIATGINRLLQSIRVTVQATDALLLAQSALPSGLAGLTARIISKVENFDNAYRAELKEIEKDTCDASKVVVYIATQLNLLVMFISVIDALLQNCLVTEEDPQILQSLNLALYGQIGTATSIEYRGYTIEIRTDPNSPAIAPRRYAVALDPVGVVVLTGPSSFSSNTDILIQELKFRIDNQLG